MFNDLNEHFLRKIMFGKNVSEAPSKTQRIGVHYEAIIGIGKDHIAHITMTDEAFKELNSLNEKEGVINDNNKLKVDDKVEFTNLPDNEELLGMTGVILGAHAVEQDHVSYIVLIDDKLSYTKNKAVIITQHCLKSI